MLAIQTEKKKERKTCKRKEDWKWRGSGGEGEQDGEGGLTGKVVYGKDLKEGRERNVQ